MAYYNLEPFGEERADLRSGIVAAILVNANSKKGARTAKPLDFMPFADHDADKATTPEQQQALMRLMIVQMRGGHV